MSVYLNDGLHIYRLSSRKYPPIHLLIVEHEKYLALPSRHVHGCLIVHSRGVGYPPCCMYICVRVYVCSFSCIPNRHSYDYTLFCFQGNLVRKPLRVRRLK